VWNAKGTGLADVVERYCKKGDRLYVEGRIEYRQWQDKENQTRYTTEINVRDLLMLGAPQGGGRSMDYDSDEGSSRGRAPARSGGRSSNENFDDFPAALEDQDDDLPF
jgi:single-strand DNA-binding protein